MTLGEYLRQSCVMVDFMVIDQTLTLNAVLERPPSLRELRAITSVYHLLMKFSTPNRVGEVKRDQQEARQCYNQVVSLASKSRQFHVID